MDLRRAGRSHGMEVLARVGYLTKGVVYAIIGVLALEAAFGLGGGTTNAGGAVQTLGSQPFGKVLLALAAFGLGAYALWCFARAVLDVEGKGSDGRGIARRVGYAGTGVVYASLCTLAVQMFLGGRSDGGSDAKRTWLGRLLAEDWGQIVVVLFGIGFLAAAVYQVVRAWKAKFRRAWKLSEMSAKERLWATRISRFGIAARAVVLAIIGYGLLKAGLTENPGRFHDLGQALATLGRQTYGDVLLSVVAAGLVAYGVYQAVNARYRRIPA
jgi:hypothetical protein